MNNTVDDNNYEEPDFTIYSKEELDDLVSSARSIACICVMW